MSQQVISENAHINEFERMMDRLAYLIEFENNALEKGEIHALASVQQEKGRLSFLFKRKWNAYKEPLQKGDSKRAEAFRGIVDKIEDLKHLMKKNQRLLTVAKINSANRISAGMEAWKRHNDTNAPSYGMDGCADPYRTGPHATTSRLI